MRIDLFPVFVWEHLIWWSQWLNDPKHTGRADVIGAGTTALIVALAVIAYVRREGLRSRFEWIKAHPVASTIFAAPVAGFALICLSKFATFVGATLTVVGLLVTMANNRRANDREGVKLDREARKFEREAKSARAALPLELSALTDYCRAYNGALNQLRSVQRPHDSEDEPMFFAAANKDVKFPDVPPTVVATLKEIIKSTDDEIVAQRCMDILSYAQYVKGYASVFAEYGGTFFENEINHAKLRTALLYSLVSSTFVYARGDAKAPYPVTWLTVDSATNSLGLSGNGSFLKYLKNHTHRDNPLDILKPEM